MNSKTRRFSIPLPYGLLYVSDAESDDNPDVDGKGLYGRTGSMLAIACQGDQDGPGTPAVWLKGE